MNDEEFIKALRADVVDEALHNYGRWLTNSPESVKDPLWREFCELFSSLTPEQQDSLRRLIRQVIVDTSSHIFGVLDSTSYLEGRNQEIFSLTLKGKELAGALQEIFLAFEEEEQGRE